MDGWIYYYLCAPTCLQTESKLAPQTPALPLRHPYFPVYGQRQTWDFNQHFFNQHNDVFKVHSYLLLTARYIPARRGLGTTPTNIVLRGTRGGEPSITKSESRKVHGLSCTCIQNKKQRYNSACICITRGRSIMLQ